MSETADLLATAQRRLYPNYKQPPMVLARGRGSELFDVEGRRWLDLAAGVAVCSLGHAHPAIVQTISEQAARLMHTSNYFYNEENIRLAAELCEKAGMSRAFFCNSGAEANEALLKLARRHFFAKGDVKRTKVVAFHNAFHGRTMGAVSMTGTPKYREGFGEVAGVEHVAYGDADAVAAKMGTDVAAIIVEPVQGEGGVLPAPDGFLARLRTLADHHGALLLLDEVQTGVGRTGRWFGFAGLVKPDAIALAKGMGGGFPIGAMLCTEALSGALPPGTHGSTFGGNPLGSAVARTVLRVLEQEKLVDGAKTKGAHLAKRLAGLVAELPGVCESERGEGLLRGLVLKQGFIARDILPKIADAGVLLTAAGERVLRFTPPLVITEAELDEGVAAIGKVLRALA